VFERYKNGRSPLQKTMSINVTIDFDALLSTHSLNMASLGNASPTNNQSFLFDQMPLLDLFFPGLGPATGPAWALLTGGPSIYSQVLCIGGLLLLFEKYASEYIEKLVETYLCQ
jgi:hypothetical protein